jgi:hypothetical protein
MVDTRLRQLGQLRSDFLTAVAHAERELEVAEARRATAEDRATLADAALVGAMAEAAAESRRIIAEGEQAARAIEAAALAKTELDAALERAVPVDRRPSPAISDRAAPPFAPPAGARRSAPEQWRPPTPVPTASTGIPYRGVRWLGPESEAV